ncbi:M42 family metallopeptidase [soil metagenome]
MNDFLHQLLMTPSPSGYEQPIQALVRKEVAGFTDEVRTDRHGNVFASRNPAGSLKIMMAGHCDQIGLLVQHIDAEGFLYVQPIGGWDMQILLGQQLSVWTKSGPIPGVVSRKAIHLLTPEERNKVPNFQDVWIDIGAKNKEDALAVCRPGDPVTFRLGVETLRNGLITSPGLDDKVGLWVVMEALRVLKHRELKAAVHSVSTVAEEIGLRGATTATYAINPDIGLCVDVCHATDTPGADKKQVGDIKLGGGPVIVRGPNISPRVFDLLEETAIKHTIPYQIGSSPRATGTDANAMQISREGVAVGLVAIPNRYMHSPVEVCHMDDLVNAAMLLAEFCAAVGPETNVIP